MPAARERVLEPEVALSFIHLLEKDEQVRQPAEEGAIVFFSVVSFIHRAGK